jgi:catechol 2,3-dioxygenase-like lactoylglutathione lyase family enzyme
MVMLTNAPVTTILPVMNMDRARDFYENKLGLKPIGLKPDGKFVYACGGGAVIALFFKEGGTKADHTAEDYDFPGLKTVDHVCVLGAEKAAWFKDTEGNYLCIHEDIA